MYQVTTEQLRLCIKALRYYCYNEAGQTQKPDLFKATDYEEWDLAAELDMLIDPGKHFRELAKEQATKHGVTPRQWQKMLNDAIDGDPGEQGE